MSNFWFRHWSLLREVIISCLHIFQSWNNVNKICYFTDLAVESHKKLSGARSWPDPLLAHAWLHYSLHHHLQQFLLHLGYLSPNLLLYAQNNIRKMSRPATAIAVSKCRLCIRIGTVLREVQVAWCLLPFAACIVICGACYVATRIAVRIASCVADCVTDCIADASWFLQ